ncbi:trypco2 family protein [Streptomyces rubiginosohelvolus]|uniref:Trypco2 family protein n=1 Tax=Streptomyces rubiginosohelvolus TaxID=67362 RepID=A0ABW6ERS4_9ACTN
MGIPLAQALAELRRELHQAQGEGAAEQFRFEVEPGESSLHGEFRSDGKCLTLQVRYEALGGREPGSAA